MLHSFFLIILGLCCCCCCCTDGSQIILERPRLYGPKEALVKSVAEFQCEVPNHPMGLEVLLQIFKLGDYSKVVGEATSMEGVEADIPVYVRKRHDGYLECRATIQNSSISDVNATFSYSHYLKVIEPVKGAQIIHSGLVELFEESTLELNCTLKAGNYVSYKWLRDGQLISPSSSHNFSGNQLTISRVTSKDSGSYRCEATNVFNQTVFTSNSSEVEITVKEPVKGAQIIHSGLVELFEESTIELNCTLKAGNYVSYKWLRNGQLIFPSSSHSVSGNQLTISRVTSKDSGSYRCEATNVFNQTVFTSNSSEVEITVKDLVSAPEISFTVLKEEPHNYFAMVRCESTRGALPITFSLYLGAYQVTNVTVEERHAEFKLPLVLNQHLGDLRCHASNGEATTYSQHLPLYVVPVGGPVTMDHDYDSGENYAIIGLRLYCKAEKGTHPRFQWFLNNTLLQDRGSFYYVVDQPPKQSILLLSVGRSSAGTYHCEVSDNFDNSTAIRSKTRYLDKEVLNRIPDFVVGIVFGSFAFLIFLVSACCCIGVIFRRRQYGEKSLWSLQTQRSKAAHEDELDLSGYSEDPDLLEMLREDEFDQASEASEDERPWIQKETLKDEPV